MKDFNNKLDDQQLYEKILKTTVEEQKRAFSPAPSESYDVKIRKDNSVTPSMFLPDPLIPGGYKAHELTIRAMRKNLFVAGEDIDNLEELAQCASCSNKIDLQFWICCPHCGAQFSE